MKRIYFTVTNDLTYDQRMHRICSSLSEEGFDVVLVGRKLKRSLPLQKRSFKQVRLPCYFINGSLFYAEYNLRLFFYLLFRRMNGICAIDLDTILPCLLVSKLKSIPRIYDAHEFFTEMKEVRRRPAIQKIWMFIEKYAVPRFEFGYTVSESLAGIFNSKYNRNFITIRNLPVLREMPKHARKEKFILYQGAVNEGRGFESLIPAMKEIPHKLVVCGDGNFMKELKRLIAENKVQDKVELKGMLLPDELWPVSCSATLGIGIADPEGIHQFFALQNKFFDYMHAGIPHISMDYPEYKKINDQYRVAVMVSTMQPSILAQAINNTMQNELLLEEFHNNCMAARRIFCWQEEEKVLIAYYKKIFSE